MTERTITAMATEWMPYIIPAAIVWVYVIYLYVWRKIGQRRRLKVENASTEGSFFKILFERPAIGEQMKVGNHGDPLDVRKHKERFESIIESWASNSSKST